jgi:hypothetical protein
MSTPLFPPWQIGDLRPEAVDHFMLSMLRDAANFAGQAKFLREGDRVRLNDDCLLPTVSYSRDLVGLKRRAKGFCGRKSSEAPTLSSPPLT